MIRKKSKKMKLLIQNKINNIEKLLQCKIFMTPLFIYAPHFNFYIYKLDIKIRRIQFRILTYNRASIWHKINGICQFFIFIVSLKLKKVYIFGAYKVSLIPLHNVEKLHEITIVI